MTKCKICGADFTTETKNIVMCSHKEGDVHMGCCTDICSWDKKPCNNAIGIFEKA